MSPLLRLATSAANMRQSRSRKSPLSMVPPGNWCEIFRVVAAWAVPMPKRRMVGAASADAMIWRRVSMVYPLLIVVGSAIRTGFSPCWPVFVRGCSRLIVRGCVIGRGGTRRQAQIPALRPKPDIAAAHTREQPFAEDSDNNTSNLGTRGALAAINLPASTIRDNGRTWGLAGNNTGCGIVVRGSGRCRFRKTNPKDDDPMTTTTRIGLGLSAALVSLGLAFAPAVFAQDKMGKDDGMKKESMSKDAMKKDDGMMKKDGMKHDGMMKDGMKKDDGMKKN